MSTTARRYGVLLTGLVLTVASFAAASAPTSAVAAGAPRPSRPRAVVPAGFTDTIIAAHIHKPVALAATPDGRILVVDQSGKVRVIENDVLLATPALDISAQVCSNVSERGMLGLAIDPDFAVNGFVYVYYTFKKFPVCDRDTVDVPVNRVSRFKMVGDTIRPRSEKILVDEMISYHGIHNAGMLGFGHDGMLYASVGDGGCDYEGAHGCDAQNTIAQRTNSLQGKVLRITPNGGIPRGNPFTGPGTARCNQGAIAAGMRCQEIYLFGLRNPFRFAFDPNSVKTRLFVDDVGQGTWEEIDQAVKGANYGWNTREGPCATGSVVDCGAPPPGFTNPIFAYTHAAAGCEAITGGAFIPSGVWGAQYSGGYFFGDFVCGQIFLLLPDGAGGWTSTPFASGIGIGGPVALLFGPHAGATSLYYTSIAHGGEVHVIDQT
jgi:glucose/arabinose dehydrogenase